MDGVAVSYACELSFHSPQQKKIFSWLSKMRQVTFPLPLSFSFAHFLLQSATHELIKWGQPKPKQFILFGALNHSPTHLLTHALIYSYICSNSYIFLSPTHSAHPLIRSAVKIRIIAKGKKKDNKGNESDFLFPLLSFTPLLFFFFLFLVFSFFLFFFFNLLFER